MPIQIQLPDGSIGEFPDGMSDADIERVLQQQFGAPQGDLAAYDQATQGTPLEALRQPQTLEQRYAAQGIDPNEYGATEADRARKAYDDSPWYQRPFIAAGAELTRLGRGAGQLVTPNSSAFNQRLQEKIDADAPMQDGIHGVSGFIGRALPYAATLPIGGPETAILGRMPQAGRLAQVGVKAATAAGEGAAYGGLGEVRSGESRLGNLQWGALGGLAGRGLVGAAKGGMRGMARPADNILRADIETAQRAGIPLHPSQVSDSIPAKTLASASKYLPFTGGAKAARNQQNSWNRALTREAGKETDRLDDEWLGQMREHFNKGYDDIWSRNDVTLSPQSHARMQQIVKDAYRDLGADGGKVVENQFNRIKADVALAGQNGKITGRNYQALREGLAKVQPGTSTGEMVGRLRAELIGEANNSIGKADAQALRALDKQYNNYKTLQELLKRPAGAKADVSPNALWAAVNKRGPKATDEFRALAKVGKNLLADPIQDSGTAGRAFWYGMAGGGGAAPFTGGSSLALPVTYGLLGATVGRAGNSLTVGGLLAKNAGKANAFEKILNATGKAGAVRRGTARGVQRGLLANAREDAPIVIDVIGGKPVTAEEYARLRAKERGR